MQASTVFTEEHEVNGEIDSDDEDVKLDIEK